MKHVRRKGKAIVCAVDLKILMEGMPECEEENWEFKEQDQLIGNLWTSMSLLPEVWPVNQSIVCNYKKLLKVT